MTTIEITETTTTVRTVRLTRETSRPVRDPRGENPSDERLANVVHIRRPLPWRAA